MNLTSSTSRCLLPQRLPRPRPRCDNIMSFSSGHVLLTAGEDPYAAIRLHFLLLLLLAVAIVYFLAFSHADKDHPRPPHLCQQ